MAFNKVILMGNLVENPELKSIPSGAFVTNFRIAVSRKFKKEGQPEADFITITAWNNTAKFVTDYFSKGRAILVCGKLQSRSWVDNDGNKRYTLEVEADEVSFVDRKPEGQASAHTPSQASMGTAPISEADFVDVGPEEDLPF